MKIISIISAAFLLWGLFFSPTASAESLYAEKAVVVNPSWRIVTTYRYVVFIETEDELSTFREIILPDNNPVRSVQNIFGSYGSGGNVDQPAQVTENRLVLEGLQMGDTVSYGYEIASTFFGFEGTFSDVFQLHRHGRTRHTRYDVTFPEPIDCQWMIDSKQASAGHGTVNKIRTDQFVWDSSGSEMSPRDAVLRVTTFMSWDEVARHYSKRYWGICDKTEKTELPASRPALSDHASEDEKVAATIALLENEFEYRTSMSETHCLLPASPQIVLGRKWGDCKDITLLGVTLLNALGIDAFPVLLGPDSGQVQEGAFPDPYLFQHAVMGIRNGTVTRYYDWTAPAGWIDVSGKRSLILRKGSS